MNIADELSIQLYSLREFGGLNDQLATLAALGFKRVETVGGHLADAAGTRGMLERYGMTAPTGHVGLDDLRTRPSAVIDAAGVLGLGELYMPAVPAEERYGQAPSYWQSLGEELGALAERFAGSGLKLGYHNHHWELEAYGDGTTPLDHLLKGAEGSKLTLEVDAAWLIRGGSDPLRFMAAHGPRITAIHVKDLAPEGENADEDGWADIGAGTMDWPGLWRAARSRGAPLMVLEHDKPSDPVRFARESRAFLMRALG